MGLLYRDSGKENGNYYIILQELPSLDGSEYLVSLDEPGPV